MRVWCDVVCIRLPGVSSLGVDVRMYDVLCVCSVYVCCVFCVCVCAVLCVCVCCVPVYVCHR